MARYHITAKGEVNLCRAVKKPCPLGGEHFSSKKEAAKSYEKAMGEKALPSFLGKNLTVANEEEILKLGERPYRMNHQAPVKDGDDFNKPLHELTEIFPKDVYEHPDWYGQQYEETFKQLRQARGNPEQLITVYRAVPKEIDEINPGDWLALSYKYARGESYSTGLGGSEGQVIRYEIPAKMIYTDANSLEEWGFSGNMTVKGVVVNE